MVIDTSLTYPATSSTATWDAWNEVYYIGSGCTTTATYTWSSWNNEYIITSGTSTNIDYWMVWNAALNSTERTVREIVRNENEWRIRAEQRALEEKEAKEKAEQLLLDHLNQNQVKTLKEKSFFDLDVISKDGSSRKYRIRRGRAGNVNLLGPNGKPVKSYCIHPNVICPDQDTMLAQKLMLETNEEEFLKVANEHRIYN